MNFDACVTAIEALSGELVEVEIQGRGAGSVQVAEFWGQLRRMGDVEFSGEVAEVLAEAVVGVAVTFVVENGNLSLLPSRFVGCRPADHRKGWFEIETLDATISIGPKRPAWYD